ncbi:MAG: twin-arginine translocase TatA/TatE family subunit [Myxococcales bacterium]
MFNLGMGEITVILLLALIFLGPKKLPELASGLGKLIREIRKTTADVKNEIQLDDAIRKPFEELRDAVTLHPEELKRRDKLRKELAELQRQAETMVAAAEETVGAAGSGDVPAEDLDTYGLNDAPPEASPAAISADGHLPAIGAGDQTMADITPPPPLLSPSAPAVPGAAPVGTVARGVSGAVAAGGGGPLPTPPAPPLAAVLAKGSGAVNAPNDRRTAQPPTGSDFLRSLRAVPEGAAALDGQDVKVKQEIKQDAKQDAKQESKIGGRIRPSRAVAGVGAADPNSAADRGNTTQALTEADLAAITVRPPPPPPPPSSAIPGSRNLPPSVPHASPPEPPARLPGATPPKPSNR